MSDGRCGKLTERQRQCLRGVLAGYSAKEIAEQLGISPGVVNEHLTAARRLLDVGRSIEAARMLAISEDNKTTPHRLGVEPMGVDDPPARIDGQPDNVDRDGLAVVVRDVSVAYDVGPTAPPADGKPPSPIPGGRGDRHDLTIEQKMGWGLGLAFLLAALAGALVALQQAVYHSAY